MAEELLAFESHDAPKSMMFVRLTKKLAEVVNGIDLSNSSEGDVVELPEAQALMLIAERWAESTSPPISTGPVVVVQPIARAVAADRGYVDRRRRHRKAAPSDAVVMPPGPDLKKRKATGATPR